LGEIIATEILEIVLLVFLGGLSATFILFLLRQRSQLIKLQNQIKKDKIVVKEEPIEPNVKTAQEIDDLKKLSHDDFSENLKIVKDLQSKLDGLTIEMKIRGEMIIERDTKIGELEKTIHDFEAQIEIFKNQIAPALEQTIMHLRSQETEFKETIEEQRVTLQKNEDRLSAAKNILKGAKMGQILDLEQYQVEINKKDQIIKQQEEQLKKVQEEVDQLPYICLQMTNEIKKRESEVNSLKLYNSVLNKKLLQLQNELSNKTKVEDENIITLTKQFLEIQDKLQAEKQKVTLLDKELLILNSLIMEKESKIINLEERIVQLIGK